jgi:hypothetical protein
MGLQHLSVYGWQACGGNLLQDQTVFRCVALTNYRNYICVFSSALTVYAAIDDSDQGSRAHAVTYTRCVRRSVKCKNHGVFNIIPCTCNAGHWEIDKFKPATGAGCYYSDSVFNVYSQTTYYGLNEANRTKVIIRASNDPQLMHQHLEGRGLKSISVRVPTNGSKVRQTMVVKYAVQHTLRV